MTLNHKEKSVFLEATLWIENYFESEDEATQAVDKHIEPASTGRSLLEQPEKRQPLFIEDS